MTVYTCERCLKDFKQKSHYDKHLSRKIPCPDNKSKVEKLAKKIIQDKNNVKKEENDNEKEEINNEEESIIDLNNTNNENKEEEQKEKEKKKKKKKVIEKDNQINSNIDNIIHLKPIIKWSGGKADEIKQFINHIPENINTYLEPFCGGASVFFYLNPKKAVINDVHKELICFYKSIKDGKGPEIYEFMTKHKNDDVTYYKVRDEMVCNTDLDHAKRFYYLRKTCFRGMLRYNKSGKFNIPFGKYKTINYEDLKNKQYETIFKNTKILNNDFEDIFKNYNDENNFMFLDPPYDSEFTDYGYCKFEQEQQKKLAKLFKETKIKCMIIIGKTKFIEELYKDYIVGEYEKKYRFKIHSGRVGDEINTKHLIIKNYK
jgi:DNA adenine methylase